MRNKTGHWFSPLVSLVRKDFGRKLIALFFALLVYFVIQLFVFIHCGHSCASLHGYIIAPADRFVIEPLV